jgi:hypothetical protein
MDTFGDAFPALSNSVEERRGDSHLGTFGEAFPILTHSVKERQCDNQLTSPRTCSEER